MRSPYEKKILGNGLKIIAHRMPERQSVSVGIWIAVGGRYESSVQKGIAHFLEHLLFKGTKKYSCRKIKESIEGVGGSLNGFTSEELTCYLAKIPAAYLKLALGVLSDMVLYPALPALEIEKEKPVILEELKMHKDLPQSYVSELLDELLWPKQALGAPIIGSIESINRIDRKELLSFKEKYYTPINMAISVAGCLDYKELTKKIAGFFPASLKKGKDKSAFLKAKEEQDAPQLKVFPKETEQTHLALGFHSLRREHPLKHALGILHVILGANMSSRLFNELREKRGMAYEIGTQLKRFQDTGSFAVHAGIDNRKVGEALALILKELKKIKERPPERDEFRRAREFYLGQLELALEDTLEHMLWIGEGVSTLDKAYSLEEIIRQVNKLTKEDVRQAAKLIFNNRNLNLALIGPLKDKEGDILRQLRID